MTDTIDLAHFTAMRQAMVASQLRTSGVNDVRVIEAMSQVARERFCPPETRALAYSDTGTPLGHGRMLNPPLATGRLLIEASVQPADRVLLIGAATGYTATLLSRLAAEVVAVESDSLLVERARLALAECPNVLVVEGPLPQGAPDHAPFDLLVIDGAVEAVPDRLSMQLRPGGRAVSGILDHGIARLSAGRRSEHGFRLIDFADIDAARLPGFDRPKVFSF